MKGELFSKCELLLEKEDQVAASSSENCLLQGKVDEYRSLSLTFIVLYNLIIVVMNIELPPQPHSHVLSLLRKSKSNVTTHWKAIDPT